ncbi:stage III sporulation protein AH [Paenibacillus catalpae]|uniref:Stage III sporulation protein AH n=1 Tax=Paenibacillus catalpae TaxID=1045775 RepID=A0A1I2FCJ9_9BACL|nr:SpoIIIAH-like family protein [Paenibacillus catalpae]SFF02251.1 stage III sporulation protein AH [Paenibacillus catalpae]
MNTKRQTIWLVSMLSLMVVLSAYYLFTQDTKSPDMLSDGTQTEQKTGATEAAAGNDQIVVDQVDPAGDATDDGSLSEADKQVLEQIEAQGGVDSSVFSQVEEKRSQLNSEQQDKLFTDITNLEDPKEAQAAATQLEQLEEKNSKLTSIENELMKSFQQAIVNEEGNGYKVLVESDKLDKSQAANIIDLVMKTLGVDADQVSVQFIQ